MIFITAGCGEQIAEWILNGRPSLHMYAYDIRRFSQKQTGNLQWATERSHEAYTKNYSIVFPHDESLAGRNLCLDPLHSVMLQNGAMMEERHGWERPGYFLTNDTVDVSPYDWGINEEGRIDKYAEQLRGDYKFSFSDHHDLVKEILSI